MTEIKERPIIFIGGSEVYKIISEYPAYRISNFGKIQTRWQMGGYYNGFKVKDNWKFLKPNKESKGYLSVNLSNGRDKPKRTRVHNLVAKLFIGDKPFPNAVIRHLDSNPQNNHVKNLCYGTHLENENDKINNGTWNTRNGGAKITPQQVIEIRKKLNAGISQKDLAMQYKISRPTVTRIANNKIWKV